MKHPSELRPTRREVKLQQRKLHEQQRATMTLDAPTLSPLECLPVELIQHIFFECLEANLASTSQALNQALSDDRIYTPLILFAYFRDNGLPVEKKHFRPAKYRELTLRERYELQCNIVRRKWCTASRIKACLPTLCLLAMAQAYHRQKQEDLISQRVGANLLGLDVNSTLSSFHKLPNPDDEKAMCEYFLPSEFKPWYQEFVGTEKAALGNRKGDISRLPYIVQSHQSHDEDGPPRMSKPTVTASSLLNVLSIPDYLLEGRPWTKEKIALLQLLRQGLRYQDTDHVLDISAAAVFRGMEDAIRSHDDWALLTLVEVHTSVFRIEDTTRAEHQLVDAGLSDKVAICRLAKSYHPIPASIFHLAAKIDEDSSTRPLLYLCRASAGSMPSDDPILTAWALRAKAKGDGLGDFILRFLEGTYEQRLWHSSIFTDGNRLGTTRNEDGVFPKITFASEIGYPRTWATNAVPTAIDGSPCGGSLNF